jgi:hypothetical protein
MVRIARHHFRDVLPASSAQIHKPSDSVNCVIAQMHLSDTALSDGVPHNSLGVDHDRTSGEHPRKEIGLIRTGVPAVPVLEKETI